MAGNTGGKVRGTPNTGGVARGGGAFQYAGKTAGDDFTGAMAATGSGAAITVATTFTGAATVNSGSPMAGNIRGVIGTGGRATLDPSPATAG